MTTYHRYDLCPHCNTRLDLEELVELPDSIASIVNKYNATLYYKGEEITVVYCSGCKCTYERQFILDYWKEYYLDKDLD